MIAHVHVVLNIEALILNESQCEEIGSKIYQIVKGPTDLRFSLLIIVETCSILLPGDAS